MLLGLALVKAGAWLLVLGRSPYYVVAGLVLAATGVALSRRSTAAYWLFAFLMAGSLSGHFGKWAWTGGSWLLGTPWVGRGSVARTMSDQRVPGPLHAIGEQARASFI